MLDPNLESPNKMKIILSPKPIKINIPNPITGPNPIK